MNILDALKAQTAASGETFIDANPDGPTTIPGGEDVLLSDFAQLGTDLQITLPTGESVVVVDYFAADNPSTLQTDGGAVINSNLVAQLAGPMVPDPQMAQTGTSDALGEPAGSIDSMKGEVIAVRGGVEVELGAGDPIYEGDLLVTSPDSAVGIIFADNSTMSMGGDARISIDEMVYDASAQSGSQLFDIVQGAFVFASGQIGKNNPEDVQVRTPVATIGIRGTKYAINVDQELGEANVTLFEGAVVVENGAGQVLLNSIGQSTLITSAFAAPREPFNMDAETQTRTYGDAIDYHPNTPQLREDDDGGGSDGQTDTGDLGADDLEKLAEELDDIDSAAGPSGAIAGFTESTLFLRLLNGGVLDGNTQLSGTLGATELDNSGLNGPLKLSQAGGDLTFESVFSDATNLFQTIQFNSLGETVYYTYGGGNANVAGGAGFDLFSINASGTQVATGWTVGQNAAGNVIISEIGGAGTQISMNDVEELEVSLGSGNDSIVIGDLTNTDIADSTVFIQGGAGNDTIQASDAGKRMVLEGDEGDDIILASSMNDDIRGGTGNDIIDGGAGRDLLMGEEGDDTLIVTLEGGTVEEIEPVQGSEEVFEFGDSTAALARPYDIVHGGEGDDTVVLRFDLEQGINPQFVAELVELKEFIASGDSETTMTYEALGLQISGVEHVTFLGPFPALTILPSLDVGAASEDGTVAVGLALDGEADSPFLSVEVTVAGVPEGAVLIAANGDEIAGGSSIVLTGDQIGDFSIQLAPDSDEDFALDVSVSSENVLLDTSASASTVASVAVTGIADDPIISVTDASGTEDGSIGLSIDVGQGDADGSETLTVELVGLPEGSILTDANGTIITDYTDVPVDMLSGLLLQPPANFSGTIAVEVIATSAEGETTATSSQSFSITVEGVADAPEISVSDVISDDGDPVALTVSAALTDTDSESLSVEITGMPEGFSLTDGENSYTGNPASVPPSALQSLVLIPAVGFAGTVTLAVVATATEADGDTNSTSETFSIEVGSAVAPPILSVLNASGDEDSSIALTISAAPGDDDDVVSVTITGLPDGAVLTNTAGEEFTGSDITLTPDQLAGLTVTPAANSDEDFTLTVTATAADGEVTDSLSSSLTVSITGVADTPTLSVSSVEGVEDHAIALDIAAIAGDTDGSELLTVEISGLDDGFVLTDASGNSYTGNPVEVPASALPGLSLTPPTNFAGNVSLTVRAVSTESGSGDAVLVEQNMTVSIASEIDTPTISVGSITGNEDTDIPLNVSIGNLDPSEAVTITIDNLPEGAVLTNAAGDSFSGASIELTLDQLTGLTVTPPTDSSADMELTMTVTTSEDGQTATSEQTLNVTVAAKADTPTLTVGDVDVVLGGAEATTETGTDGDDTIIGGSGGDTLIGGDGNDHLIGDGDNLSATVSLDISAVSGDIDGSEVVTVTISGLPEGVQILQAGEVLATGGAVTLPSDMLDQVQLIVPPGTADFDLQVTARSTDFDVDGGGDSATSSAVISVSVNDGAGLGSNDVLDGGAGDDILEGGAGADTLIGGTGSDTLLGGSGNDILRVTWDDGSDIVQGGSGTDALTLTVPDPTQLTPDQLTDLQNLVTFVASGDAANGSQFFESVSMEVGGIEALTIIDGDGLPIDIFDVVLPDPDAGVVLTGDADDNNITGTDNDDTLSGGNGNDIVSGGGGNDVISGDNGNDTLFGGAGDDTLMGGNGDDVIHADGGSDTVDAGSGDDLTIVTINPEDVGQEISVDGGSGQDTLRISLDGAHPDLQGVIAEIAAASVQAGTDPSATTTIASLGVTFTNYENVEIYVDDELVDFDPAALLAQEPVGLESSAMAEGAAVLDGIELSDTNSANLTQATVEISGGFQNGDLLSISNDVLSSLGLTLESAQATEGGFALTISGNGSLADYQEALSSVLLASDDSVPEAGQRTVSVTVTDDDGNQSAAASVTVDVALPPGVSLADTSEVARDSVATITEASTTGATVAAIDEVPDSVTQTLTLEVARLGHHASGQFEVLVGGQSLGTFSAPAYSHHGGSFWNTVEIANVSIPLGEVESVEIRPVGDNSGVAVRSLAFGETELHASDDSWDHNPDVETDDWHQDWIQNWEDQYGFAWLDHGDATVTVPATADGADPLDDWQVTDGDDTHDLSDDDLGDRVSDIDMGEGTDWAVAAAGTEDDLTVDLGGDVWNGTENVLGGQGDDILTGNDDANLLAGGAGDDLLIAVGDNDLLVGGSGDDEFHYDVEDLQAAAQAETGSGFGQLDQAISDAYAENDIDGAEALENIRAGVDGGSGSDLLKLSGGGVDGVSLSGDDLANAVSNLEILDVTGVDGPVDMSLSVDDLIQMTDDRDELTILKDGDDTVNVGGQEYGAGEHTFNVDGVDFKLVIEETDPSTQV